MQRSFSQQEQQAVGYFYKKLKAIYQGTYDNHFKNDERLVKVSKREWAEEIGHYNEEQIDKGVAFIKKQFVDLVDGWEFFHVGRCVGAIKEANTVKACHKISNAAKELPLLKADPESVSDTRQGLKELFA